jgi:anthranilate synthase
VSEAVTFRTRGGVQVTRTTRRLDPETAIEPVIDALDEHIGVLLASSYEYPGRYTRWDIGFVDPPLQVTAHGRDVSLRALNERGRVLLPVLGSTLAQVPAVGDLRTGDGALDCRVPESDRRFPEEQRSRQPSVFSVIRALLDLFHTDEDSHLGLYGAFGYDLAFQFEPVPLRLVRPPHQRDLVLFLPDRLVVVDHSLQTALEHAYEFTCGGSSTLGRPGGGPAVPYVGAADAESGCDHPPGGYAQTVRTAHESFRRGNLFEVVPSQTFTEPCPTPPSTVFRRLRTRNPSPYGCLMNLGDREYLVGASPEMYVRVTGRRVESCPISGTIARGEDALVDADRVLELLNSKKDESELTMCTDVDRNDKSRICEPGSVRVLGRRQIEVYSKLIHTADHVEGRLREGFDALDAFLSHAWAVTVTGAPKLWAMRFIEDHEHTCRRWYGGAIGCLGFDGNMNTGLTLRTMRIRDGLAEIRAGATLLIDSDPDEEERETGVKAAALIEAVRGARQPAAAPEQRRGEAAARRARILLVDHEDSFVHTLAGYLRQTGAEVVTMRSWGRDAVTADIRRLEPDLVFLSPGPGCPRDFDATGTIAAALDADVPVFGVCLGLQGIVEHFGGRLGVLPYPMHGKPSEIEVRGGRLFEDLPSRFVAGRYHSLYALPEALPDELEATAVSTDGVVMAVEHRSLPVAAVQFHPESIMTLRDGLGLRLLGNVLRLLRPGPAFSGRRRRGPDA